MVGDVDTGTGDDQPPEFTEFRANVEHLTNLHVVHPENSRQSHPW